MEKGENLSQIPDRSAGAGRGTNRDATVARVAGECLLRYLVVREGGLLRCCFPLCTAVISPLTTYTQNSRTEHGQFFTDPDHGGGQIQ